MIGPLLALSLAAATPAELGGAREVMVLHGEDNIPLSESTLTAIETVLNHLGLAVTYQHVGQGLPDPGTTSRLRGIISMAGGNEAADPAGVAGWLRARQAAGLPVLLLNGAAFLQEDRDGGTISRDGWQSVLAGMGMAPGPVSATPAEEDEIDWLPATWPAFEAPRGPVPAFLTTVTRQDPAAEAPLRVRSVKKGGEGDVLVVGPQGAYAAGLGVLFEVNPLTYRLRWRVDPFKLFSTALRTQGLPALDPTTVNGRRAFFAHIDGDGFTNMSIEPKPRMSAEVIRDEVLARTWLPTTVSIIASEVAGKKNREDLARSIYRLPGVEAAVHSWHHPHDWDLGLLTPPNATGDVSSDTGGKKMNFDPRKEVDAAVAYVQRLLPPGKRTAAMLWSGKTNPTARFLERTHAIGVANLNGGDAMIQPGLPSVAAVSPYGRRVGPYVQVFSAAANENIFTNLWQGPFDGQRRALDYYHFTGGPRRLSAVNIYYHFYAGERRAGLSALRDLYGWCERAPLAHLTASSYARNVEGFFAGRVEPDGPDAWKIDDAGACRTVRFSGPKRVDLDASTGVAGYLVDGDRTWVHLSGPVARVVRADAPPERPRLHEASAVLADWRRVERGISAGFDAAAPARVVLAGLPPGAPLTLAGDFTGPPRVGVDGKVALTAGRGRRLLEVRW